MSESERTKEGCQQMRNTPLLARCLLEETVGRSKVGEVAVQLENSGKHAVRLFIFEGPHLVWTDRIDQGGKSYIVALGAARQQVEDKWPGMLQQKMLGMPAVARTAVAAR